MLVVLRMFLYFYCMKEKTLTPEIETVIDMMGSLSKNSQEKIVDLLYDVISEVDSDEKWKTILSENSGPMENLAELALKEHREKKTRPL